MRNTEKIKAFEAMKAEAQRLNLPQAFRRDLDVHDLAFLQGKWGNVPEVFGWVLYDCGTHIIDPGPTFWEGGRKTSRVHVYRKALDGCFTQDRHCYVWDGLALHEMSTEAMLDRLEEHREAGIA